MRVLLVSTRGAGHFGPLAPFGRACMRAGHDVLAAVPPESVPMATRAGLPTSALDDVTREDLARVFAALPFGRPREARRIVVRELFGRLHIPAALPSTREVIARFAPDLVLRETFHYASALAAEEAGLPHVRVAPGMAWVDHEAVAIAAEGHPALAGAIAAIERTPLLTLAPPGFDNPHRDDPAVVHRYRDDVPGVPELHPATGRDGLLPDGERGEPGWLAPGEPLVYVTFGSVAASFPFFGALIDGVLAALAELPVRALVTLGERTDPASLGELPPNVRVERWVPQAEVLAHAAAMVCHGGFGTVLGGLYAGVPMVLVPMFADQPRNAARVAAIGAGVVLERGRRGVSTLGDAVREVLGNARFAAAAGRVAAEAAALPPVDEAVVALEGCVRS